MKKNWSNPELSSLSVILTKATHIEARQAGVLDFDTDKKYQWICRCCGESGPLEHDTEQEAIEAGIIEHGNPCPKSAQYGCSA